MTKREIARNSRGFYAIGVYHPKTEANIGTLWRTATLYNAAFIYTIGHRYQQQASDTPKTPRHMPLFHFDTVDDLRAHLPWSTPLVGIELDDRAQDLPGYAHPERACYLLGAEDHGLPQDVLNACHDLLVIPGPNPQSMNVSVAGSLVMYDRWLKGNR